MATWSRPGRHRERLPCSIPARPRHGAGRRGPGGGRPRGAGARRGAGGDRHGGVPVRRRRGDGARVSTVDTTTVTLTVNGREITVPKGLSLVEAAAEAGIEVP